MASVLLQLPLTTSTSSSSSSTTDSVAIGNTAGTFFADVTSANALKVDNSGVTQPVLDRDVTASGSITTENLVPTGTATAGSAVEITCEGKAMMCFQVTGTFTGSLAIAQTVDGTNWKVSTGSLIRNSIDGGVAATVSTTGIFQISCAGFLKIRVFMLTSMTGTAVITMLASSGGEIVADALVATQLTSQLARMPTTLGQKTMANSYAITIASDQTRLLTKNFTTTSTYAEDLALTTVTTITAPANAVGVLVMADASNANNIRIKQGGSAASLTSGFQLQPGRDLKFDVGTDLSVISDNNGVAGASVKIYFNWYVQV